jgi:hypothetical protein
MGPRAVLESDDEPQLDRDSGLEPRDACLPLAIDHDGCEKEGPGVGWRLRPGWRQGMVGVVVGNDGPRRQLPIGADEEEGATVVVRPLFPVRDVVDYFEKLVAL